ncbi:hypothetical protein RND81_05G157800 [Saponaria officinalis]|uniref:Uncharacterized protein n=1 Tax=Saponaria officinalis TaxID=3572 RepID=A0AAW1KY23_SAPOF
MDFSLANCAKVMKEFAKDRVKMPPYDTTGGWRDPDMWSTLMRAVVGSNCPKMRDSVLEIIFTFEYLFMQGGRFKITDDKLRTNVYTVFDPGRYGYAGSLRTCNLDPSFLAVQKVDSDAVPLSILEYDGDGACGWLYSMVEAQATPLQIRKVGKRQKLHSQPQQILNVYLIRKAPQFHPVYLKSQCLPSLLETIWCNCMTLLLNTWVLKMLQFFFFFFFLCLRGALHFKV